MTGALVVMTSLLANSVASAEPAIICNLLQNLDVIDQHQGCR